MTGPVSDRALVIHSWTWVLAVCRTTTVWAIFRDGVRWGAFAAGSGVFGCGRHRRPPPPPQVACASGRLISLTAFTKLPLCAWLAPGRQHPVWATAYSARQRSTQTFSARSFVASSLWRAPSDRTPLAILSRRMSSPRAESLYVHVAHLRPEQVEKRESPVKLQAWKSSFSEVYHASKDSPGCCARW